MANFKSQLRDFFSRVKLNIEQASGEGVLREMAQEAIRLIQIRTRLGYGVKETGAKRERLTPLKPKYKVFRAKNRFELDNTTSANRSNVTFSGQMLGSMKIVSIRDRSVVIGPAGRRSPVLGVPQRITNRKLAQIVQLDGGRPFMPLSDLELRKLDRFYRNRFGDLLTKRIGV